MHFGTRLDKQTRCPRSQESIVAQKNKDGNQSSKNKHEAKSKDRPTIKEGPQPRTTQSSQSRSTNSFATSRTSHGSNYRNNQMKILPSWIIPNTAHSIEVLIT
ncbi:hypothetical protein ACFX2B_009485 [Malus domestica]